MNTDEILHASPQQILSEVARIRTGYALKRTLRYATTRDFSVHNESVAEHVFALLYLSRYFLPLEHNDQLIDVERLDTLLLFHDFGEIINGDIVYNVKTDADIEREKRDAETVAHMLPETLRDAFTKAHTEYELRDSREAQFAFALDKVEPLFELYDPVNEKSLIKHKFTSEISMGIKIKATESFPVMRKFVDVINQDMIDRDVFWREGKE